MTGCRYWIARQLPNKPHEAALERGQHTAKVVAPLEHCTMLADECERPLLLPKRGAFLDPDFRSFRMPAKGSKHGNIRIDPKRIVAPVSRSDHPSIKVEDAHQFFAIERSDWAPIPGRRERRDDAQALFTFDCGALAALNDFSSLRSSSISSSSSANRVRTGSRSSPHGVP